MAFRLRGGIGNSYDPSEFLRFRGLRKGGEAEGKEDQMGATTIELKELQEQLTEAQNEIADLKGQLARFGKNR